MKRHVVAFSLLVAAGVAASNACAEDEIGMISVKRMNMETAMAVASGAVAACREKGIQITAAVVDRYGTLQALARDTIAPPISVEIAQAKAYTAANFGAATSSMTERADSPVGRYGNLVMSAGGLPIEAGGALLGAVGVSGAPAGETDEECAQAGLDAVQDDLEMAL